MSSPDSQPVAADPPADLSRRAACAALGLGAVLLGPAGFVAEKHADWLLADAYGLMRRAYQSGDAELLRQFYSDDVVLGTEGASPVVGLDAVVAAGHQVLAKRRDITAEVLRISRSAGGDSMLHTVRLSAYPRDPADPVRIATAFLYWQRGKAGWRCHTEVILLQDLGSVSDLRNTPRAS